METQSAFEKPNVGWADDPNGSNDLDNLDDSNDLDIEDRSEFLVSDFADLAKPVGLESN